MGVDTTPSSAPESAYPYEQLADALDQLPNGFPRTTSKVEIAILRKIFSPEEASLASQLSGHREPLDVIAE
jgi:hypothetical protein